MKNNYRLLLIALIATVGFASCGKDGDTGKDSSSTAGTEVGTTIGGKTYLISKLKYSDSEYSTAEYDAKGRIVKFNSFYMGDLDDYSTVAYTGNTVTIIEFGGDNKVNQTLVLNIGTNGYAKEAVMTETYKEGAYTYSYKATVKLTHNSEGYVTKMTQTSVESSNEPNSTPETETGSTDYTYSNGNLQRTVEKNNDNDSYTVDYEYYTDKAYSPFEDLHEHTQFIGKASKNLIKKIVETDKYNGQTNTYERNYTYTFDSNGLPNKVNKNPNGSELAIEYIVK